MAYDNKHPDDTLSEEASAFGKRVKGAAKDGIGALALFAYLAAVFLAAALGLHWPN